MIGIRSLRARLLVITAVLMIVGISVSDAVVTTALRRHLVDRVDGQLAPIALVMARVGPASVAADRAVGPETLARAFDLISALAVAYVDADGTVTGTRSSGAPPPAFDASLLRAPTDRAVTISGDDGTEWRAVVSARPGGGVAVVAASLTAIDATITEVRVVCLITGAVVVALLTAVGGIAVRAGLRPLRTIEESAAAIAGGNLAHRIPDAGPPGTEVARLTGVLNTMLTQIERSFAARTESEARMRRFVADVSHELRTPLSGIKGSAELHLMRGTADPDDVHDTMRRIDTEAGRLAALVEDLLLLARLDETAAGRVLETAPMDLRTLAADARHDLRSLDPDRPVALTGPSYADDPAADSPAADAPAAALVLGDEARLRQVVSNLVGNVHAHTPPDAPVRIGVGRVGDEAVLEIADSGPGLAPADVERVFERFHRADDARARGSRAGGAGLGLAIVRSLVSAHGGRVDVAPTPGGGATFRLALPWLAEHPPDPG